MTDAASLEKVLAQGLRDGLSPGILLMRLIMVARQCAEIAGALERERAARRPGSPEAARLETAIEIWRNHPAAFDTVRGILKAADHSAAARGDAAAHWGQVFDRVATVSPEAAVALYSLGSRSLLDEATDEVVAWLRQREVLSPTATIVDLGCGIGRIAGRIAPLAHAVIGVDVSAALLLHAATRWTAALNLLFVRQRGHDLACLRDEVADLVLAVDVMPYLVDGGSGLAGRHMEEARRVLKPGGQLIVMNWSYRGDRGHDRAEAAKLARLAGLTPGTPFGEAVFSAWDGLVYCFSRPA